MVEKESYLLELCRYIVLNPVRVKGGTNPAAWKWSSYRAIAGLLAVPEFLSTDWLLDQFGQEPVGSAEAVSGICQRRDSKSPWDALKGQIYLGNDEFIERHSAEDKELKEIPRAQLRAIKPTLDGSLRRIGETAIAQAYRERGYRLQDIAAHLGVHYATVSRKLKKIERRT